MQVRATQLLVLSTTFVVAVLLLTAGCSDRAVTAGKRSSKYLVRIQVLSVPGAASEPPDILDIRNSIAADIAHAIGRTCPDWRIAERNGDADYFVRFVYRPTFDAMTRQWRHVGAIEIDDKASIVVQPVALKDTFNLDDVLEPRLRNVCR